MGHEHSIRPRSEADYRRRGRRDLVLPSHDVERRTREGRSKREIIRSLKRYVARELYRYLPRPQSA